MIWTKELMIQFIELYKSYDCLWNTKHPLYVNRIAKNSAYQILIEKVREFDHTANRETIVKKINSLRTTFRKELRKVFKYKKKGEHYVPNLWYFPYMMFLTKLPNATKFGDEENQGDEEYLIDDSDIEDDLLIKTDSDPLADTELNTTSESEEFCLPQPIISPLQKLGNYSNTHVLASHTSPLPQNTNNSSEKLVQFHKIEEYSNSHSVDNNTNVHTKNYCAPQLKSNEVQKIDECNGLFSSIINQLNKITSEDRFDITGRMVAAKLRSMTNEQRVIAEKLISDVLFEGELGNLNRDYSVSPKNLN